MLPAEYLEIHAEEEIKNYLILDLKGQLNPQTPSFSCKLAFSSFKYAQYLPSTGWKQAIAIEFLAFWSDLVDLDEFGITRVKLMSLNKL